MSFGKEFRLRTNSNALLFASPNSTPSPHRTPPPQRQGVIQRHNAGGSKPPSPAPNRLHIMPQHHYALPGMNYFVTFSVEEQMNLKNKVDLRKKKLNEQN